MNFIKKWLGLKSEDKSSNEQFTTMSRFLGIDLSKIPDETFTQGNDEITDSGTVIKKYRKLLDYKILNLFNVIEIYYFSESDKNVFLKNYNLDSVNLQDVEKLINQIYLINGPAMLDLGTFNSKDIQHYFNRNEALFGRMWYQVQNEKYKYTCSIGFADDGNCLQFALLGAKD